MTDVAKITLASYRKSGIGFRLAYLHSTSANSKDQSQGHAHLCSSYLVNRDRYQNRAISRNMASKFSIEWSCLQSLTFDLISRLRLTFLDSHGSCRGVALASSVDTTSTWIYYYRWFQFRPTRRRLSDRKPTYISPKMSDFQLTTIRIL